MVECENCGQCCFFEGEPCPFVDFDKTGKSRCKIYKKRVNRLIKTKSGNLFKCNFRIGSEFNYVDCPYNKFYDRKVLDNREDVKKYLEMKK